MCAGGLGARLVVLDNLVLAAGESDKFNDALKELTRGTSSRREDDNLEAQREREAGAEDCDTAMAITAGGEESDGDWF